MHSRGKIKIVQSNFITFSPDYACSLSVNAANFGSVDICFCLNLCVLSARSFLLSFVNHHHCCHHPWKEGQKSISFHLSNGSCSSTHAFAWWRESWLKNCWSIQLAQMTLMSWQWSKRKWSIELWAWFFKVIFLQQQFPMCCSVCSIFTTRVTKHFHAWRKACFIHSLFVEGNDEWNTPTTQEKTEQNFSEF